MNRTMKDLLSGIEYDISKKIGISTVKYTVDNTNYIKYHDTIIVSHKNDKIVLNSDKHRTKTTKSRINDFLAEHCELQVTQDKSLWYIDDHLFYDGITIINDKVIKVLDKSILKKSNMYKKQIDRYMAKMDKMYNQLGHYPYPNGGDCWLCLFNRDNDNDHILQHLKECYVHGTLIKNALISSGYQCHEPELQIRSAVKRSVKKYLKKATGLLA